MNEVYYRINLASLGMVFFHNFVGIKIRKICAPGRTILRMGEALSE